MDRQIELFHMIPRYKSVCQQVRVTTTQTYHIHKCIYDNSLACPAELTSLLLAKEGMGSSYIGLPSSLVWKRGHKYATFGEEGVPRNSDMRQVMYGNYVREPRSRGVAVLKSWEK
jgi:hypothetical protein